MPNQNSKEVLDFLETLGSKDRGDNVTLGHTARVLGELAGFLIEEATANLQNKGHMATGETAASMKIVNVKANTNIMSLDVELLSTYKFLDQGVRGTEGGAGKYSFKTKYPSKKMALAILKWYRKRGAGGKIKYKAKSKNEGKNQKLNRAIKNADNLKSLAYATATNIKKKGIEKTLFFSNAIKATKARQKQMYAKAFKLDIIESINKN